MTSFEQTREKRARQDDENNGDRVKIARSCAIDSVQRDDLDDELGINTNCVCYSEGSGFLRCTGFPMDKANINAIVEGLEHCLSVGGHKLSEANCELIVETLKAKGAKLFKFKLTNSSLTDASVLTLASLLSAGESIEVLSLENSTLRDAGSKAIAKALREEHASLARFDLDGCPELSDEGVAAIFEALCVNTSLRRLVLGETPLAGKLACRALVKMLQENRRLAKLKLFDFPLDSDATAVALAEALSSKDSAPLRHLVIYNSGVTDAGALAIAEMLKVNSLIGVLDLSENCITKAGASAIAEALKVNKTLYALSIAGNPFASEEASLAVFADALAANKNLIYLDITEGSSSGGASLMVGKLSDIIERNRLIHQAFSNTLFGILFARP